MPTPVIIVDDHPLFRKGLESLLMPMTEIQIVAQFSELAGLNQALDDTNSVINQLKISPVVILDRFLGDHDSLTLVPLLKEKQFKIVMLTVADQDFEIREAIQQGVDGYIIKSAEAEQIIQAILSVAKGNNSFPSDVMRKMVESKLGDPDLQKLSQREVEIVTYVARGLSNRAIGEALELSENTVRNHLRSILEKLELDNRVQVATFALKRGIAKRFVAKNPEDKSIKSRKKKEL